MIKTFATQRKRFVGYNGARGACAGCGGRIAATSDDSAGNGGSALHRPGSGRQCMRKIARRPTRIGAAQRSDCALVFAGGLVDALAQACLPWSRRETASPASRHCGKFFPEFLLNAA
jgi:hypothetical protein